MTNLNSRFLSDKDNLQSLMDEIDPADQELYHSLGFNRADPAFQNKFYIIYKPTGLHSDGTHRDPEVLGTVRIVDWFADAQNGPEIIVEDMRTGDTLSVGVIPTRVFDYDIFFTCPPYSKYRFDAKPTQGGLERSMLFTILIKSETRAEHYSKGVTLCVGTRAFKDLYPDFKYDISYY